MVTIHLRQTTTATPAQFLAALTDFGPGRAQLFGATSDDVLRVHSRGTTGADVTEGTHAAWERLQYDWSDPRRVVMKTIDSNLWGGASGHVYTFTAAPDGTTTIDAVVVREGRNVKGKLTGVLLGGLGKRVLAKALAESVKAVEQTNGIRPGAPPGAV